MEVGEEVDWGPDDEVVIEGEWNPLALDLLKGNLDFAKYKVDRRFRFVHLFRGPKDVLLASLSANTHGIAFFDQQSRGPSESRGGGREGLAEPGSLVQSQITVLDRQVGIYPLK